MNKYRVVVFCLGLLLFGTPAQAQETVEVTVTDFAGLRQAINLANQQSPNTLTQIYIVGKIYWTAPAQTPDPQPIRRVVRISGGIFSEAEDGGGSNLFIVESSGKLTVTDSKFVDISSVNFGPIIFSNQGELALENVTFTSVSGSGICLRFGCTPSQSPIIYNGAQGKLTLKGVRFENSGSETDPSWGTAGSNGILANEGTAELVRTQVFLSHNRWEQPLYNSGFMRLQNSSFLVRNYPATPVLDLLETTEGAQTESVNSVFEGFTGTWCGQVESLGHNSTSAPDCTWASPGDEVGTSTGLIWREIRNRFNLIPDAGSSIVDTADSSWCPDDGREIFDGDGNGSVTCDRGAWEHQRMTLADGGANGLYFDPNQNGHYVYVLDNYFNTLVVWNTFDRAGNQAWILATGELIEGKSMIAEAYTNENGELTPLGPRNVDRDLFWGTIQLQLDSCGRGKFTFNSDLPDFTSGQFEIRRLAYVRQIGCDD